MAFQKNCVIVNNSLSSNTLKEKLKHSSLQGLYQQIRICNFVETNKIKCRNIATYSK